MPFRPFLAAFAFACVVTSARAETCKASHYGHKDGYNNGPLAQPGGERLDTYGKLTAAHKSLPFGSHVKVTNLKNGRSVVVRINDRGPFIRGRCIDLTYLAAQQLGMDGLADVVLE